jgi:hypothetical protein
METKGWRTVEGNATQRKRKNKKFIYLFIYSLLMLATVRLW